MVGVAQTPQHTPHSQVVDAALDCVAPLPSLLESASAGLALLTMSADARFKADESGLLLVFMEPGADVTLSEFHEWYDTEHVPLRIQRFGTFRSAARYAVTSTTLSPSVASAAVAVAPVSSWGAFYTVSSNATFADTAYTSLRSERSQREAELFTRLAIVDRRIYKLEYDSDLDASIQVDRNRLGLRVQSEADTARYLVTNSVDLKPELMDEYNTWFDQEHAPMLSTIPGWKRSRRFTLLDNGVTGTHAQQSHAQGVPTTLGLHGKFSTRLTLLSTSAAR